MHGNRALCAGAQAIAGTSRRCSAWPGRCSAAWRRGCPTGRPARRRSGPPRDPGAPGRKTPRRACSRSTTSFSPRAWTTSTCFSCSGAPRAIAPEVHLPIVVIVFLVRCSTATCQQHSLGFLLGLREGAHALWAAKAPSEPALSRSVHTVWQSARRGTAASCAPGSEPRACRAGSLRAQVCEGEQGALQGVGLRGQGGSRQRRRRDAAGARRRARRLHTGGCAVYATWRSCPCFLFGLNGLGSEMQMSNDPRYCAAGLLLV